MATLSNIKRRLREQSQKFRLEPEYIKAKYRDLYRVARDAVDRAERLEWELHDLRNPQLGDSSIATRTDGLTGQLSNPTHEKTLSNPRPTERYSRAALMKSFVKAGALTSPAYLAFLKFTGLTHEEALKLVDVADFPLDEAASDH